MHNRSYNEQDAIQRLLLFEEGLSRLIELMKIEKKDVLRLLLALVAVFVIGVLGEFVCNFPALRANGWTRQATRTIALDEVQESGFERVETA